MGRKKSFSLVNKKLILTIVIIMSLVLYLAGVLSGLAATKVIKKETQEQIDTMKDYVNFLERNQNNVQLYDKFMSSLDEAEMCDFVNIIINSLIDNMRIYWNKLPSRIEAYEYGRDLSDDYLDVKKQYNSLSIKTWVQVKSYSKECGININPVLYFYSSNCKDCIKQGLELDNLQLADDSFLVFTVDFDSDDGLLKDIKQYYGINSTPSIVINDRVFQGRVFNYKELMNH